MSMVAVMCWKHVRFSVCHHFVPLSVWYCNQKFLVLHLHDHKFYGEVNSVKNRTINIWLNDGVY